MGRKRDNRPISERVGDLEKARAQVERTILEAWDTGSSQFMREQERTLSVLDERLTYLRGRHA